MSTTLYEGNGGIQITRYSRGGGCIGFQVDVGRDSLNCTTDQLVELTTALQSPDVRQAVQDDLARWGHAPATEIDGKRVSALALDVLHEGNEGREMELATDVIMIRGELERLRKVLAHVDLYLEEAGDSELCFSHVAQLLRQAGFAKGPGMDEFFAGTALEKRS